VSRLRSASKAPLAVAGILALPLFFVGLMAFSLKLDKPSQHATKKGTLALGDPTKGTVGSIYLVTLAVVGALILVGVLAMLLRSRLAAVVPAVGGIIASVLLVLPLGTWAAEHTQRYPLGIDNIPKRSAQDQFLRGEWEGTARTTAHQLALVTIGLAIAAIVLSIALEFRRRRGIEAPPVAPPPAISGVAEASPVVELELADSDLARGQRPGRWRWR
jgi:hypothetical protein